MKVDKIKVPIKKHRVRFIISPILMGIAVLIFLSWEGYEWANWTGFKSITLWQILELIIVPLTLAIFIYFLNKSEGEIDRKLNVDNQHERLLQGYLDSLTMLILEKDLKSSKAYDEVREIARIKTLTTLKRIDNNRKGSLIEFLFETGLINHCYGVDPIISLKSAQLEGANLTSLNLIGVNFENANLKGAFLESTDFKFANFIRSNLTGAHLDYSILINAQLKGAHLEGAFLEKANLRGAHLEGACLEGAILERAHLESANLLYCNLKFAHLKDSNLGGANLYLAHLDGANLEGANLILANLLFAHLEDVNFNKAIMPDGRRYDPEIHTIDLLTTKENYRNNNFVEQIERPIEILVFYRDWFYREIEKLNQTSFETENLEYYENIREDKSKEIERLKELINEIDYALAKNSSELTNILIRKLEKIISQSVKNIQIH